MEQLTAASVITIHLPIPFPHDPLVLISFPRSNFHFIPFAGTMFFVTDTIGFFLVLILLFNSQIKSQDSISSA